MPRVLAAFTGLWPTVRRVRATRTYLCRDCRAARRLPATKAYLYGSDCARRSLSRRRGSTFKPRGRLRHAAVSGHVGPPRVRRVGAGVCASAGVRSIATCLGDKDLSVRQ